MGKLTKTVVDLSIAKRRAQQLSEREQGDWLNVVIDSSAIHRMSGDHCAGLSEAVASPFPTRTPKAEHARSCSAIWLSRLAPAEPSAASRTVLLPYPMNNQDERRDQDVTMAEGFMVAPQCPATHAASLDLSLRSPRGNRQRLPWRKKRSPLESILRPDFCRQCRRGVFPAGLIDSGLRERCPLESC